MKPVFLRFLIYLVAAGALVSGVSACTKDNALPTAKKVTPGGNTDDPDDPGDTPTDEPITLAPCTNKVVAPRGGSKEYNCPDNSRQSLRYAMYLKCYASECDIYWTKDNNIIIGHADSYIKINNLHPYQHTVDELRKAGKLKNGEELPTLDDFLDIVMVKGNCTKLLLDIKNTVSDDPKDNDNNASAKKAVQRACEIIHERKAEQWCEFICTGYEAVASVAAQCLKAYGIPIGWMANVAASYCKSKGFTWANLCAASAMTPYGSGTRTIDQFINAGLELSIFNIDKQSGDSNAVYSDEAVAYYVSNYSRLRFLCTNYPSWLLAKVKDKPIN